MRKEKKEKVNNNKKSIIGFFLTVFGILFIVWELFEVIALAGLLLCIVGLFESIKDKNKLFYPIAGIVLGIIFTIKLFVGSFIYLCSSYSLTTGILAIIVFVLGLVLLGIGIYYYDNYKKKKEIYYSSIILGIILIIIFGISFLKVSDVENRLQFKLKEFGKQYFETDSWMKGGVSEGVYSLSLDDLEDKLHSDVSIFEKYKCNKVNTRVELVVEKQIKKKQTNYSYNIILDCDL